MRGPVLPPHATSVAVAGKNSQSRGWLITVPETAVSQEELEEALGGYAFFAGQLEEGGKTQYRHWQLYLEHTSPVRFSTLRSRLPKEAHLERRQGTKAQALTYVTKEDTRVGPQIRHGELEIEDEQGRRTDLEVFHEAIVRDGRTAAEVMLEYPGSVRYSHHLAALQRAREARAGRGRERNVLTVYVWGAPGVGKTRFAFETFVAEDMYRVTDYTHPFDGYVGESVLVLDEFAGQLPLDLLLNVLDRYPLSLPARYNNRWAAFTSVLVLSNHPLSHWYPIASETRRMALARRFALEVKMLQGGRLEPEVEMPWG